MHIGLMMACDLREGGTQREAFDEALATAEAAEALGFDGVWLAERHFAAPGGAAPVSSIESAPCSWRRLSPPARAGSGLGRPSSCCPWDTLCVWQRKSPRWIT
jgi:alkanesulfonate monooxygenase SsuD/methylene tetrahydromethanopterin reductase-like flavin-dependent oxidoreductase (luciferase family)